MNLTLVEANRLRDSIFKLKIVNYVLARQNDDGGYCFAQGALESSGQDTYYALVILNRLNVAFPNAEKTVRFFIENRVDSIYSLYYATKARSILGKAIDSNLKDEVLALINSKKYFGSSDFFSEVSSSLRLLLWL